MTKRLVKPNGVREEKLERPANDDPEVPRIEHKGIDEIFAPLPPMTWLVEQLRIAPGAPAMIAGYGFSMKSLLAQDLAVSVAAGAQLLDGGGSTHKCKQGKVLHIDHEQGFRLTAERYQRLVRGKELTPEHLGDRLCLAVHPSVRLDSPGVEDVYRRTIEGFDLVIVDSLAASTPTLEENASEIRGPLDKLARLSEETGVTFLIVHHGRKGKPDDRGAQSIRGSSAIFDACATVFLMGRDNDDDKESAVRVKHHKCRHLGVPLPDFGVRAEDVNGRAGLVLRHEDRAQLDAKRASGASPSGEPLKPISFDMPKGRGGRAAKAT